MAPLRKTTFRREPANIVSVSVSQQDISVYLSNEKMATTSFRTISRTVLVGHCAMPCRKAGRGSAAHRIRWHLENIGEHTIPLWGTVKAGSGTLWRIEAHPR
jgi:hypothetical protein